MIIKKNLIKEYKAYYKSYKLKNLYPSEYLIRIFLSKRNRKLFNFKNYKNENLLDLSFGDGRNLKFFDNLGFSVYGTEISKSIININSLKQKIPMLVGMAHQLPFKESFFKYIVSSHSCYYLDRDYSFNDNLTEISRVLKKNGFFICTIPKVTNYYIKGSKKLKNNEYLIKKDYLKIRNNYRLFAPKTKKNLINIFSKYFKTINIGLLENDYFGIKESMFIVVCKKK